MIKDNERFATLGWYKVVIWFRFFVTVGAARFWSHSCMWIWEKLKFALSRFVPQHVNDPFGLVGRMLTSKNRAALFTLWLTALGVVLTPVDWLLQFFERKHDGRDGPGPHIFICGPARSGTTLVYQVLAATLPVAYPRNFTALFSRAPILGSKLFTRKRPVNVGYQNFYGKTSGMQSPSEANHLWNQWVMPDESHFRTRLTGQGAADMATFFSVFSREFDQPTLTKNNNANAFADAIANQIENAYFICMRREKRYLAQSLVRAREVINGDIQQSYGVVEVGKCVGDGNGANKADGGIDPVPQVIEQIEYLDAMAVAQQQKIGDKRFWIVDYESFCDDPSQLINSIKLQILGQSEAETVAKSDLPDITNNNRIVDKALYARIEEYLESRAL